MNSLCRISLRPIPFRPVLALIVILFFLRTLNVPMRVCAQDAAIDGVISYDEVNAVAKELYCPVCPNELLSDCQTQACIQWKTEISDQLAVGQSPQQIIDSFVRRYGDRVAHVPQDPFLRALSLVTPFAVALVALIIGARTFLRWGRLARRSPIAADAKHDISANPIDNDYRARLERDLEN